MPPTRSDDITATVERPALDARQLSVAYGPREVVRDAGIQLRAGHVTALIGPNGSGKSTLLRAIARLQPTRDGILEIADENGFELSLRQFAQWVALLTQGRPTPSGLSVREVVEFGRYPHRGRWGGADAGATAAVEHALELTGMTDFATRPVDQLSGGQLQRVWLASCLAQDTAILLLDEPTTYLDLRYQVELLDLIRDLAEHRGIAIGVVLHDLDQAAAIADRIVILSEGRVVADGEPNDVLQSPLLSSIYGIRIDVHTDPSTGRVRTRAIGRHNTPNERHQTPS